MACNNCKLVVVSSFISLVFVMALFMCFACCKQALLIKGDSMLISRSGNSVGERVNNVAREVQIESGCLQLRQ